jgi:hypothetical protein
MSRPLGRESSRLGGIPLASVLLERAMHVAFTAKSAGVPAYRVVMVDAGTATGAAACADALGNARGLIGVTYAPVATSSPGTARRLGLVEIDVETGATPEPGQEAFLSDHRDANTIGGFCTNAIDGTMYPRSLGVFRSSVSSGRAWVELAIDESRDDAREWLIQTWAPTVAAASYTFSCTGAGWRELKLLFADVGPSSGFVQVDVRPNGAANLGRGVFAHAGGQNPAAAGNLRMLDDSGAAWSYPIYGHATFRRLASVAALGPYLGVMDVQYSMLGVNTEGERQLRGFIQWPTTGLALVSAVGTQFQANIARVQLSGKVAIS